MQRLGGNVGLWRRSDEGDSYKLGSVALVRAALWRGFKIQVRGVLPLKTGVVYRSTSIFQIHLYF